MPSVLATASARSLRRDRQAGRPRLIAWLVQSTSDPTKTAMCASGFFLRCEGADPAAAHAVVEDLLSIAGISAVGGRTAERNRRTVPGAGRAGRCRTTVTNRTAAETLRKPILRSRQADRMLQAVAALRAFSRKHTVLISSVRDSTLSIQRLAALEAKGIRTAQAFRSPPEFGRRLDYYSGFVFEIHAAWRPTSPGRIGRRRALRQVAHTAGCLGANVPAIGFSMWLDRIAQAARGRS